MIYVATVTANLMIHICAIQIQTQNLKLMNVVRLSLNCYMDCPTKTKNFDAWKGVKVPRIDVTRLKNLQHLSKHGIRGDQFVYNDRFKRDHNHEAGRLYSILLDDELAGIDIIQKCFDKNKYVLNINLYFTILDYLHEHARYTLHNCNDDGTSWSDISFIFDYLINFDQLLIHMSKLHLKECKLAIKYINCKKLRYLNLKIKDKSGKQSDENFCDFCVRQKQFDVWIRHRNYIWHNFITTGYSYTYDKNNYVEIDNGCDIKINTYQSEYGLNVFRDFGDIHPCPLHKHQTRMILRNDQYSHKKYKYNCISIGVYNHCVIINKEQGLFQLFSNVNSLTDKWLLDGEFFKIYQFGKIFFRGLFDQNKSSFGRNLFFLHSINVNELLLVQKFVICLSDLNKQKLLIDFFAKCESVMKIQQQWEISQSRIHVKKPRVTYKMKRNDFMATNIICCVSDSVVKNCDGRIKSVKRAAKWLKWLTDKKPPKQLPCTHPNEIDKKMLEFETRFQRITKLLTCLNNNNSVNNNINIDYNRYRSNQIEIKKVLLQEYDEIYKLFFEYSMYLFKCKSKYANKYFQFCIKLRPLYGYLHFQYSLYLSKITN